jgi:hypothetical protein
VRQALPHCFNQDGFDLAALLKLAGVFQTTETSQAHVTVLVEGSKPSWLVQMNANKAKLLPQGAMMSTQRSAIPFTASRLHTSPALYRPTAFKNRVNEIAFERFLGWLGPDPETAGMKYETIRTRLIIMFRARRCVFAEDLADATFDRVARKLNALTDKFTGDPARYFYGVGRKIYQEYHRQLIANDKRLRCFLPTNNDDLDSDNMLIRLDEALSMISNSDRELILSYYTGSGRNKINHRRALAQQFGLGPNALRLRVFRIRKQIQHQLLRSNTEVSLGFVSAQC